jgi:hypothetical protein
MGRYAPAMTEERPPANPEDPGASTERFRRFASSDPGSTPPPASTSASNSRVLILLAGVVVLGLVIWALLTQL